MAIKVGFVSLGCPKNLLNTEVMLAKLVDHGMELVAEDIEADVIVINTCAFIESAKNEAIENILDIAWLKKNRSLKGIVVTGCLPQRYREEIFKEMPEVNCILGTGSLDDICEAVEVAYKGGTFSSFGDIDKVALGGERVVTTPEYFAYVQIAEGCDNFCSYCVIPSIRGRFRSRNMTEIVDEVKDLASIGVREVCLVAQDTTRYGEDIYGTYALDSLIEEISKIDEIKWIRVLYCYPDRITDGLIEEFKTNDKLLKYIDMPIQHINDDILSAMNRRDTSAGIKSIIDKLRREIPGIVIRTTVIVGFPGETEKQYKELRDFIKETKFERLGVFEYSREEGTPAYDMPNQVPESVKKKRMEAIMSDQNRIHNDFNARFVGSELEVLCEGYDEVSESFYGRSYADAPDIDGKIYFSSPKRIREGEFVKVAVTEVIDYDLVGKLAEGSV
jgi:ribosomal protein S12 methylthiotransferase